MRHAQRTDPMFAKIEEREQERQTVRQQALWAIQSGR